MSHKNGALAGLALGAALVAMTLVVGLLFAFAATVMPNLAAADDETFVVTMQRFNPNPVFPISFTVALILTAVAALTERLHGPGPAVRWTVIALVLYGVAFAVTIAFHVPLNNTLDAAVARDGSVDFAAVRAAFEIPWVTGNIVRTVCGVAAVAALARALVQHGRQSRSP